MIEFAIIVIYVDDLSLVGVPRKLTMTTEFLKRKFAIKDLGDTEFCLNL